MERSYTDSASPAADVCRVHRSVERETSRGRTKPVGMAVVVTLCLMLAVSSASSATTYYVSTTGADVNDGLSWTTAKATVRGALNHATSGDQVWVAAGTYLTYLAGVPAGVGLYGGFAGTETDLSQRDSGLNATVLDGNGAGAVVYIDSGPGPSQTVDGFTLTGAQTAVFIDHAAPVISNNRIVDNASWWIGVGIRGVGGAPRILGNYFANNAGSAYGGAMDFSDGATPDIEGNTITGNTGPYGGGINLYRCGNCTVIGNTITGNTAQYVGGILVNNEEVGGALTLISNTITNNASSAGGPGGVQVWGVSRAVVTDNVISGNQSLAPGETGGFFFVGAPIVFSRNTVAYNVSGGNAGGAVIAFSDDATIDSNTVTGNQSGYIGGMNFQNVTGSITNNTFSGNSGTICGGPAITLCSVSVTGNVVRANIGTSLVGGIYIDHTGGVFANNRLTGNHGGFAGGMFDIGAPAPILYNLFADNTSEQVSGGMEVQSDATIANNVFTGNRAAFWGGAIGITRGVAPRIINNTIVGNQAGLDIGGINSWDCTPLIANNIIAFNSPGGVGDSPTQVLSHNCVFGNVAYDYGWGITPGPGDISVDPQLTNPPGVLRLKNTSPCIDAGDDSFGDLSWTDMVGNPRIANTHVDIGAYEFQGKPKK